MKLLFCEACSTLVVPSNTPEDPRRCACARHAVWWIDAELPI